MYKKNLKSIIFSVLIVLNVIGVIFISSISQPISDRFVQNPLSYTWKYLVLLTAGIIAAYMAYKIYKDGMDKYLNNSTADMIIYVGGLIFLLMPFVFGKEINGARRWIDLKFAQIQPSELIKPVIIIILAKLFYNFKEEKSITISFFVTTGLYCAIIWAQRSKTSALQVAAIGFLMYCLTNVKEAYKFLIGAFGAMTGLIILLAGRDYSTNRLSNFLSGEQQTQVVASKLAIKTGSLFGRGIGDGLQKYFYLPEAHNDYIFAAIAEEGGYFFALLIIILFLILIISMFFAAYNMKYSINRYVVYGIAFNITNQFVLNLAISLNILPSTGITLPFISYGGSSIISNLICMGLFFAAVKDEFKEGVR